MSVLFSACMGKRYLPINRSVLIEQQLDGAENLDKDEIASLYVYKPNRKILFLPWSPFVDIYQIGYKRYDSLKYEQKKVKTTTKYEKKIAKVSGKEKKQKNLRDKLAKKINKEDKNIKEGNLPMRMGEQLAVFDTAKENETVNKIQVYMHTKGYFNAEVTYGTSEELRLVTTKYTIERNQPYVIDSIFYNIPDTAIASIVNASHAETLIAKGNNYQQQHLVDERERINELMLNNGYYSFNRQFIQFVVDSTYLGGKKVVVGMNIQNPNNRNEHKVYTIDSVIFTTDAGISGRSDYRSTESFNGITYQFYNKQYSKKILDWRLFLRSGEPYSRANTLETQKQLSNMDIYKFINVNFDTVGGQFIANIFTSPLKKYQTSTEAGLNVSKGLPGPFINGSIKNRNTFNGLEVMELRARIGFEGLSGATDTGNPYSSLEYGANLAFTFPQFMFPLGKNVKSKLGKFNPKSRISFGLNYNDRTEYLRTNINASLSYLWQNYDKGRQFVLKLADINYINSDVTTPYQNFLDTLQSQGNNLYVSFLPSFVSSMSMSVTHNINNYGNRNEKSSFLRYQIEGGGNLYRLIGEAVFDDNVEFFKFIKVNVDFRHSAPVNSRITLAYRVHLGVAVPFGDSASLPYEKFFFAGGSNSIRAWEPRRLGPGSFIPVDAEGLVYNNSVEQPGEVLFESSFELRHKLFGFFYGAAFVDIGNVWTLRYDPVRLGSQFKFNNFLGEMAVGAGYGIRVDFSFLLLRLDAAWKIYEPGRQNRFGNLDPREGLIPSYQNYKTLIWNLGIGYPF